MSTELPVSWVGQEQAHFCGPACVEMAAAYFGTAAPQTPPTWQEQIWDEIESETNSTRPEDAPDTASACDPFPEQKCEKYAGQWHCWATTPDALKRVLELQQTAGTYAVARHKDELTATRQLMTSVDRRIPGVALVYGWQHWIIVDGYLTGEGGEPTEVCIRDPDNETTANIGVVDFETWDNDFLWPVPAGRYKNRIVTVTGTPRAAAGAVATGAGAPGAGWSAPHPARPRKPRGIAGRLISPERAREVAAEKRAHLLGRSGRWANALAEARLDASRTPKLLERIDRHDWYAYIVEYLTAERVTARFLIDARTGRFAQAVGIEGRNAVLQPYLEPAEHLERLYRGLAELPAVGARRPRPDTTGRHPVLIWKPCRESTSPFRPFYQFSVGDRFVYLRIDGVWFDRLTTGLA